MSHAALARWGAPDHAGFPHSTLARTQQREQTGSTPGPVCRGIKAPGWEAAGAGVQIRAGWRPLGQGGPKAAGREPRPRQAPISLGPPGEGLGGDREAAAGLFQEFCLPSGNPAPKLLTEPCPTPFWAASKVWQRARTRPRANADLSLKCSCGKQKHSRTPAVRAHWPLWPRSPGVPSPPTPQQSPGEGG